MSNLVLTRKVGESIRIGVDVFVTVVEVRRDGTVRLSVEAPPIVRVSRMSRTEEAEP